MTIIDAFKLLNPANDNHWLKNGKPKLKPVRELVERKITGKERDEEWAKFGRIALDIVQGNEDYFDAIRVLQNRVKSEAKTLKGEDVRRAVNNSGLKDLSIMLFDRKYMALPLDLWNDILEWSDVDRVKYVAEKRDCDNFAVALAGQIGLRLACNGCGVVVDYSGGHAYNVFLVYDPVSDENKIVLVEPQTDEMPKVGDDLSGTEAYAGESGFIIFL